MIYFKFVVRFKLWRLQKIKLKDVARLNIHTSVKYVMVGLDEVLFEQYKRSKARRIQLDTIHVNIESLLNIIEECTDSVKELKPIPVKALKGDDDAININLDDWLETKQRKAVEPKFAWDLINEGLERLFKAIEQSDQARATAYTRKLKYVFADTLEAMESLMKLTLQ